MSVRVRQAAARLIKLISEPWTPAEVQETIWSRAKTLYESRKACGETHTTRQLLADTAITDELIASTPDFRPLFMNQIPSPTSTPPATDAALTRSLLHDIAQAQTKKSPELAAKQRRVIEILRRDTSDAPPAS